MRVLGLGARVQRKGQANIGSAIRRDICGSHVQIRGGGWAALDVDLLLIDCSTVPKGSKDQR